MKQGERGVSGTKCADMIAAGSDGSMAIRQYGILRATKASSLLALKRHRDAWMRLRGE